MSLYNMLFGENAAGPILLATLGLTKEHFGRYRNCYISDGMIAVYTRNGGGNRGYCWHKDNPINGSHLCKHHTIEKEIDEKITVPPEEADKYPVKYNVFYGMEQLVGTGKKIMQTYYHCDAPDSIECYCPACVADHVMPNHPNHVKGVDDDYDCTYRTEYFSFPEAFRNELEALDSGESVDPSQMWADMLERLKESLGQ